MHASTFSSTKNPPILANKKEIQKNASGIKSLIHDLGRRQEYPFLAPGPLEDLRTCQRNVTCYSAATLVCLNIINS